jgi:hypothetical protein
MCCRGWGLLVRQDLPSRDVILVRQIGIAKNLKKALSIARYGHLRLELRRFGNLDKVRDQAKLGIETCKK